jgi:hypothetical protein
MRPGALSIHTNTHQWKYVGNLKPSEIATASAFDSGLACD